MKRRCCLAPAMIGDSSTIFLDEPSSGLDPVKRRQFWQLIKNLTQEKAVLLTTHLMEEADTLCDEIGIITNGRLRCVGTAIGLKKTYSEGYKL
jgi:ATP-binding cassette, subfamily A (ABC1), member 3